MVRAVSLKVAAGDFAFAAGHRLTAISFAAYCLNSTAAFATAVGLVRGLDHAKPLLPCKLVELVGSSGSGFFAMPAASAGGYLRSTVTRVSC